MNHYLSRLGKSKGLIYVGANTGQELPMCKMFADRIYAFEPVSNPSVWLPLNHHADDQCQCLNFALGEQEGSALFYPSSNNFESSSLLAPGTHLSEYCWVAFGDPAPVQVRRLDSFDFVPACDVLVMDVQGGELGVLKGLTNYSNIKMIILEFISSGMYHNAGTFEDCWEFLKAHGFVYMEAFEVYNNPTTGVFAGNAVFVKQPC